MEQVSPSGPVYQAGTLSGNPLAMAGGLATLEILQDPGSYEALERRSGMLAEGLIDAAARAGVPIALNRVASMLTPFFVRESGRPVNNFADATSGDADAYARFFHSMLEHGVFLPPSQFEAFFVGLAHTDEAIEQTIRAAEKSFAVAAAGGK
jgi:glutamate-1-semialdehyde 2,1-aminomutase